MAAEKRTMRALLQEQLDRRSHVTGKKFAVEDLFDKDTAAAWMCTILGAEPHGKLHRRIWEAAEERLTHAVSTYLLGIALRDGLRIRFDQLPRFVKIGSGDSFHFFWAVTCLGHDLGYTYENQGSTGENFSLMKTSAGRKKLLGIDRDLFAVDGNALKELGIQPETEEGRWILKSIDLARKYDALRRCDPYPGEKDPVLDHGICGGLILYDLLFAVLDDLKKRRAQTRRLSAVRHKSSSGTGATDGTMTDAVLEETSLSRFAACCLIIACTVARHNMWLPDSQAGEALYKQYALDALLPGREAKVTMDDPLEQMLFLLDFLDTIDPIKAFYTRDAAQARVSRENMDQTLNRKKEFLLDLLSVEFDGSSSPEYRWSSVLRYRKLILSVEQDPDGLFAHYARGLTGLDSWIHTRKPVHSQHQIELYFPVGPVRHHVWPGGIRDHEVDALLLYEGAGVPGKYGHFYGSPDAYQTLNLLLMPGLEGEQVRVCQEGQRPDSIYIREWKMTLEVLTDIFTAQCKFSRWKGRPTVPLYRGDRGVNFRLMESVGGTFAMTSSSTEGYQEKFLARKADPSVLEISLGEKVPYFDYLAFFADQYIFSEEKEVLLPPFMDMTFSPIPSGELPAYRIHLEHFRKASEEADEYLLIQQLETLCHTAAKALEDFLEQQDMSCISGSSCYLPWKEAFQKLCHLCMETVYNAYFGN